MAAEWPELDEQAWSTFAGVHRILLRLAGQLPDEWLTHTRTMLGNGDLADLPDTVTGSVARFGVSLRATEVQLLRDLLVTLGHTGELAAEDQIPIFTVTPATEHRFAPVSPEVLASAEARIPTSLDLTGGPPGELADLTDELTDLCDDIVTDMVSEHGGVLAIWRTWRFEPDQASLDGRRVYLIEVEPSVPAWDLTSDVQLKLIQLREDTPQVEVYWTGDELSPYHRTARTHSALLWTR